MKVVLSRRLAESLRPPHIRGSLCVFFLGLLMASAQAQNVPATAEKDKPMTREDMIREHQARIERIIQENKKRQEEQQRRAAESAKAPVPTPYPAQAAPAPGQPVPVPSGIGPVQLQANAGGPPGQNPGAPGAPRGARSESRAIMFFRPFDTVVRVGETFATDVVADTKEGSADEFSFRLKYPTKILNPLSIDHTAIDSLVKGQVEYSFNPKVGEIYFHAPLKSPQKLSARAVAKIHWEAIAPTETGDIQFTFGKERTTALRLHGSNILGTTGVASEDGIINTSVVVRSQQAKLKAIKLPDKGLLVASANDIPQPPDMGLRLLPSKDSVREGEPFDVAVMLDNPKHRPLSHVRLFIQFDPADLEVVDSDRGNYIRRGVNISDGPSHESFPFDFHKRNEADNAAGTIIYDEAAEMEPVSSSGVIVRVRFQAKRSIEQTNVRLVVAAPGKAPTTDVTYLQQSTLAAKPEGEGMLDQVSVAVAAVPPELKQAAAAKAVVKAKPSEGIVIGKTIELR